MIVLQLHEDFISGKYDTSLVSNVKDSIEKKSLSSDVRTNANEKELAAATAVAILSAGDRSANLDSGSYNEVTSPWKIYGRSQQMASSQVGRSGWR